MVECLGAEILPFISTIVLQMLTACGIKGNALLIIFSNKFTFIFFFQLPPKNFSTNLDLSELIRLINQFMSKFKEKMYQPMDEIWMKVIERIYQFISELSRETNRSANGPISDIERDIVELLKTYYLLLSNLVTTNLTNVLRSPSLLIGNALRLIVS
jgi:hypothetical protein